MEFAKVEEIITEKINKLDGVFSGKDFNENALTLDFLFLATDSSYHLKTLMN